MTAHPIVKWAGGKARLLPELVARVPAFSGRYFEPFAGGAALFFALANARPGLRAVLGDANAELIACYGAVAGDVGAVILHLERLATDHSPERYLEIRGAWNSREFFNDEQAAAAAFLYLNRTCFNGLWRVNRAGHFNVPMDKTRLTIAFDHDNLRGAANVLRHARLVEGDYRATLLDARAGDFVYIDSPYVPVSKTANYTGYTADGFAPDDQRELAAVARRLTERGVHVLLSNSDTPLVRELYAWARIDTVQCDRRVAAKPGARGKVSEVIIVGEPRPDETEYHSRRVTSRECAEWRR